jgi:hypothetical protein
MNSVETRFLKIGTGLVRVSAAIGLLLVADVAFTLSLSYGWLKAMAVFLVVLSMVMITPLIPEKWRDARRSLLGGGGFIATASLAIVLTMGFASSRLHGYPKENTDLTQETGNCGAILSPVSDSLMMGRLFASLGPSAHYSYAVMEDVCRVGKLRAALESSKSTLCQTPEKADLSQCYQLTLEAVMAEAPFTLPGADLARRQGMELAMEDRSMGGQGSPELLRTREVARQAAVEFGLLEMTLRACRVHTTVGLLSDGSASTPPFYKLSAKKEGLQASIETSRDRIAQTARMLVASVFRSHKTQVERLSQSDLEMKSEMIRTALDAAGRINAELLTLHESQKPESRSIVFDPQLITYGTRVAQYNEFFNWIDKELLTGAKSKSAQF